MSPGRGRKYEESEVRESAEAQEKAGNASNGEYEAGIGRKRTSDFN